MLAFLSIKEGALARRSAAAGLAGLGILALWGWLAGAEPSASARLSGPGGEEALTRGSAHAQLSFNFAKTIAVDDEGNPHVVWFEENQGAPKVYYRRRTAKGWEAAVCLTGARPGLHATIALEGRRVYVVWHVGATPEPWIVARRSEDLGRSWEPERRVSESGVKAAHPSLAAAAGRVHLTFIEGLPRSSSRIRYARSLDGGVGWEASRVLSEDADAAWVPTIAASGPGVYAAWVGTGVGNEEEYFRASSDGGASWGAVQRLTEDRHNSWAPSLAARGEVVHVAWFDQRDNPKTSLEVERTLDDIVRLVGLEPGSEPTAGVLVPDPEGGARRRAHLKAQRVMAEAPGFAERGGDIRKLAACMDRLAELGRKGEPYSVKEGAVDECLRIAGIRFEPDLRGQDERVFYQEALEWRVRETMRRVQAAGPAWVARGGDPREVESRFREFEKRMNAAVMEWELYYRRSEDGGLTWGPEIRLTRSPGLSHRPSLAVAGDSLHLAWFDGRDGEPEIYYKASADGGRSWTPDLRVTQAKGASTLPSLAAGKSGAHVIWVDERGGKPEIYYRQVSRAGASGVSRRPLYSDSGTQ